MKVIKNMPNAEYHSHPAVSNSLLTQVARSPLHAYSYLSGNRAAQTPAMAFGSALHAAVLEPDMFKRDFAVFAGDRRTSAGKAEHAALVASGRSVISADDSLHIKSVVQAVMANETASVLLSGGIAESSVFWEDCDFGVSCKCRPDYWRNDGVIVDLKTTEDASPEGFARSVATYRYHVQAAHYLAGTAAQRFVFIAVEKKAPYAVGVYELCDLSLEVGRMLRNEALSTFAKCMKSGQWPGYSKEVTTIQIPAWAMPREENEEIEVSYV